MANNKLYENYLMHYRTKGSKNGYTKYPDKYTPVGEKAILSGTQAVGMNSIGAYNKAKPNINQQAAEQRRIAGGRTYGTGTRLTRENDRFNKIHEGSSKLYNAAVYIRNLAKEATKPPKAAQEAEARRIKGGNPYVNQREENRKAGEARRIAGGNPYVNQREENRKAGGNVGGISAIPNSLKISTNFSDANKRNAEQRRIKGGTYGQKTGENYYNDRGYNARAFDARMRYEKRVKTPNSDKRTSAERNARSTIGNAINDARTDKDFGSFMKKDIKDRVSKGKKKVKSLMKRFFG